MAKKKTIYRTFKCAGCKETLGPWPILGRTVMCPCGREARVVEDIPDRPYRRGSNGLDYTLFYEGRLDESPRQKGIWQWCCEEKTCRCLRNNPRTTLWLGRRCLYVSCLACSSIIDISHEYIGEAGDGFVSGCIICPECETHFWVCLDGWSGWKPRIRH